MLSYAHGACPEPLLGETIGQNLERTVARVPDADALISCHQGLRYTYAQFDEAVDAARRGDARRRAWARATGSACGAPTARSGRWCSTRPPSSA